MVSNVVTGCEYAYLRATCERHPAPTRNPADDGGHDQRIFTVTDPEDGYVEQLKQVFIADACSTCGSEMELIEETGTWPPAEPTSEDVLNLFRATEGALVLVGYPDDPDPDRRFYIGEIGGHYEVTTDHLEEFTAVDAATGIDDLGALVRQHPTTLRTVENTPLEGTYEAWQIGEREEITPYEVDDDE